MAGTGLLVLPGSDLPEYDTTLIDTLERLNFESQHEVASLHNLVFATIKQNAFDAPSPITPNFGVKFVESALVENADELKAQSFESPVYVDRDDSRLGVMTSENSVRDKGKSKADDNSRPPLEVVVPESTYKQESISFKAEGLGIKLEGAHVNHNLLDDNHPSLFDLSSSAIVNDKWSNSKKSHCTPDPVDTSNLSPLFNVQREIPSFEGLDPWKGGNASNYQSRIAPSPSTWAGTARLNPVSASIGNEPGWNATQRITSQYTPPSQHLPSPVTFCPDKAWVSTPSEHRQSLVTERMPSPSPLRVAPSSPASIAGIKETATSSAGEQSIPLLTSRIGFDHEGYEWDLTASPTGDGQAMHPPSPPALEYSDTATPASLEMAPHAYSSHNSFRVDTSTARRNSTAPRSVFHSSGTRTLLPIASRSKLTTPIRSSQNSSYIHPSTARGNSTAPNASSLLSRHASSEAADVTQTFSHCRAREITGLFPGDYFPGPRNEHTMGIISRSREPITRENKAVGEVCWTKSDGYLDLLQPTLPIETLDLGHIHFHRNRENDMITVWQLGTGKIWKNVTETYGRDTNQPIRHPLNPSIVLDTYGSVGSWEPTYISERTFNGRSHPYKGINDFSGA